MGRYGTVGQNSVTLTASCLCLFIAWRFSNVNCHWLLMSTVVMLHFCVYICARNQLQQHNIVKNLNLGRFCHFWVLASEGWREAWEPYPDVTRSLLCQDEDGRPSGELGGGEKVRGIWYLLPSVIWHRWLGDRKRIRFVTVGCWHADGDALTEALHILWLQFSRHLHLAFFNKIQNKIQTGGNLVAYRLTRVALENGC